MKLPESLKTITDTLWKIKSREDFSWAMEDILTPWEIIDIADRINILKMLKKWTPQREIAENLWISVTTVTRWNRVLQYERKSIHKYI